MIAEAAAKAVAETMKQPKVVQALANLGMEPHTSTPVEYARLLRENYKQWKVRVEASGFKPET